MKIKLDEYDIAMVNATTQEAGSPLLHNVCLREGKLAAADGYMLVVREADIKDGKHEGETLLPASIIKTIRSTPKHQAEMILDDTSLSVQYKDGLDRPVEFDPILNFKPYTDSQPFPKYMKLFPKGTTKKAHIAVRVKLLKKLLACLPDDGMLRIGINKPNDPLEFHCEDFDRPIYGMIMPMFTDWQDFKWTRHPETVKEESKL